MNSMELTNDRRVKIDIEESRFALHKKLEKYFPDQAIFKKFEKDISELIGNNFKGLSEASCRFKLLEADREVKKQVKLLSRIYKRKNITPLEIEPESILDTSEEDLMEFTVDKNKISREIFELKSKNFTLSSRVLKQKNWTLEYGQKFLAKVAERIFRANIGEYPEQIPAELIEYMVEQTKSAINQIYSNRSSVAKEYVIQKVVSLLSTDPLPKVNNTATQSDDDKKKIEETNNLPPAELAQKVLGTVRENTEYVRKTIIPQLLEQNADSQTAFWKIHIGEFHKNPFLTQLLSTGSKAESMNYATDHGGNSFYKKNLGKPRQVDVASGGIAHVKTEYLPELQSRLFSKIDSFSDEMTESQFLEFSSQIDLIMYSLHIPFDGSGRAIEDFICLLSEKYKYPLTITVLGYREAGSPLMSIKEKVGPMIKQELNRLILKNLGIDSKRVKFNETVKLIKEKFNCEYSDAWLVYDSELALITAKLIEGLGSQNFSDKLDDDIPSFPKLHDIWKQARNLKFHHIPDKFKTEFDEITALISLSQGDTNKTDKILKRLSLLKEKAPGELSEIITLLEDFTVSTKKDSVHSAISK